MHAVLHARQGVYLSLAYEGGSNLGRHPLSDTFPGACYKTIINNKVKIKQSLEPSLLRNVNQYINDV